MSRPVRENDEVTGTPRQRIALRWASGSGRTSQPGRGAVDRSGEVARAGAVRRAAFTSAFTAPFTAPFTARARRELAFCLLGVAFVLAVLAAPFAIAGLGYAVNQLLPRPDHQPAVAAGFLIVLPLELVALIVLATPAGRALGAVQRDMAARLLGVQIDPPPRRTVHSQPRAIGALLGDGPGWRAFGYGLVKLPLSVAEGYAVLCWVAGIVNITYPFWWRLFRNHPPGVHLSAVPMVTPLGVFHVATFGGTFAAFGAGVAMLLVAPWLARGMSRLDVAVMRPLLGPGRLAEQVRQLRDSRAQAVDDAATMVRRLERDLHDGAQIRLATLAMTLGMASEKLGTDGPVPDVAEARDLVAAAHRGAKDALADLRDLVRGIHPPVLDAGLPDALATLAAGCPIPVTLTTDLPARPAPAIETIAYFCVAELLANATKHSQATHIAIHVASRDDRTLAIAVGDDGVGGAEVAAGGGLAGLARRIGTVDGQLRVTSPRGGPTNIAIDLPMSA
jgi:signal transduction histidine kinase